MDMQGMSIMNASDVSSNLVTTSDVYASGTSFMQNINIDGNLTFGASAMIYVNGVMINPIDLSNASIVSPILDTGYEERITNLELENKRLTEKLDMAIDRIEFLHKWQEV